MTAHSHSEAAVEEIVRALRGARVLTRHQLLEAVNAAAWPGGMFNSALEHAIKQGRVRRLAKGMLEIGPNEFR